MGDGIPPSPEGNVVAGPSGSQPLQEIQITLSLFARLIRVFNKGYKRFGKDVVGNVAERVNLLAQNAMKLSTLDRQEPSTSDRQELMNKLLRMVDDLREREKTATPDEKANIVQARTFAYMKIWEIYGTTQLGKLSQQDREVRQETYGAALGEWILSKATSKQEVIDLFVFQAIELQQANKESAPIIIGAMLKDIGKTATPDEKANIVQARTFAYMKIWEIYGTTQLGKLSQQDRGGAAGNLRGCSRRVDSVQGYLRARGY